MPATHPVKPFSLQSVRIDSTVEKVLRGKHEVAVCRWEIPGNLNSGTASIRESAEPIDSLCRYVVYQAKFSNNDNDVQ